MNRNDFLTLMESTGQLDPKQTEAVSEIVSIFPYFHSAHLLLLKGLHVNSDVRFGNQLRYSSIYLADREILYNFLYSRSAEEKVVEINDASPDATNHDSVDILETVHSTSLQGTSLLELDTEINIDDNDGNNPSDTGVAEMPVDEQDTGNDTDDQKILSQSDLIDRFIIANPRIEPIRDKKEIPAEDRSANQDPEGGFVTETLARIYVSQGYYSRAIDIFERLILKYPEKSSYFATQIEKVKEYLKK